MADGDRDAGLAQAAHVGGVGDVAALHGVAEVVQHLGDAGHADAADADEMDGADGERQGSHAPCLLAHERLRPDRPAAPPHRRGAMLRAARAAWRQHVRRRPAARRSRSRNASGVKIALRDHRGAARLGQRARIGRLVIVDRARQRHQDRRPAGDRQFGNGGGAGARDHQMRRRQRLGHVGKERGEFRVDAGRIIGGAHPRPGPRRGIAARPKTRAQRGRQRRQRRRHDIAEHARAERAAQHQQAQRVRRRHVRHCGERGDRRAHRIAGDHRRRACRHALGGGEAQRQHVGVARQEPVGAAEHGVLLVQDHRRAMPHQARRQAPARRTDSRRSPPPPRHACAPGSAAPAPRHPPAPSPPCRRAATPRPAMPAPLMTNCSRPGEHRALQAARPRIGHQRHAPPARQQFARQRLGREEMPAGAAGRDHDGMHRRPPHGTSP